MFMPKEIDVVKARTGRNNEKISLIHLVAVAPKLFSGTLCTKGFQSHTNFSSEISLHRRSGQRRETMISITFSSDLKLGDTSPI